MFSILKISAFPNIESTEVSARMVDRKDTVLVSQSTLLVGSTYC
ncbi:hypothetical protein Spb1_14550 [Planctopirus ephydatiae]|uniref:Uncharacterized protein n=1 Tax=Planctopirus ephydatiae TaxID=2528019 RepID=A0A518GLU3_9PLAN|nr:hypothetical protein Spb1_14550 [Planctopirus ephydatiae]